MGHTWARLRLLAALLMVALTSASAPGLQTSYSFHKGSRASCTAKDSSMLNAICLQRDNRTNIACLTCLEHEHHCLCCMTWPLLKLGNSNASKSVFDGCASVCFCAEFVNQKGGGVGWGGVRGAGTWLCVLGKKCITEKHAMSIVKHPAKDIGRSRCGAL